MNRRHLRVVGGANGHLRQPMADAVLQLTGLRDDVSAATQEFGDRQVSEELASIAQRLDRILAQITGDGA